MNLVKIGVLIVFISVLLLSNGCGKKEEPTLSEDTLPPIELVQPGTQLEEPELAEPLEESQPLKDASQKTITVTPVEIPESVFDENKIGTKEEIQQALKNANLYTGNIDGKIGPLSKQAIKDFQRSHGLVVDGIVGPKTWVKLRSYLILEETSSAE